MAALATVFTGRTTIDHMPTSKQVMPPHAFIQKFDFSDSERLTKWLEQQNLRDPSQISKVWYTRYKLAELLNETDPQRACSHWVQLARDPLFPLNELSFLHAHSTCRPFSADINLLSELHTSEVNPWLKNSKLNIMLNNSMIREDDFDTMRFAFEKSKLALPMREKVNLTKLALEKARVLHNEEMASSMEARLYKLAPRYTPKPSRLQYLRIANDLRRSRNFASAIDYYERIVSHKKFSVAEKARAIYGIAKTHKLMRDDVKYIESMNRYGRFIEKKWSRNKKNKSLTQLYHDSQIRVVRSLWTKDQAGKARALLSKLERQLKNSYSLATVYWLKGRMREERRHFNTAIRWFEHALDQPGISEEFREDIQWLLAWNLYKTKRYRQVIGVIEELIKDTPSDFRKSRYRFWLAKALENSNRIEDSNEQFRILSGEDSMGYYGLLAKRALGHPIQLKQTQKLANMFFDDTSKYGFFNKAYIEWLVAVDENDVGGRYLNHVARQLRQSEKATNNDWLELFSYYAKNGEYLNLFKQLGGLSGKDRERFLNEYPELVFPRPHLQMVENASQKFNVPAELIYAIIRQESAFNEYARSPADAFGLMQLLPKVGKMMAAEHAIPMEKTSDLYKPEVNIPLGASFLNRLLKRNDSQFIPSVAAYNASEKAIQGWMRTRYRGDSIEFIEDIPYSETRSYVRLVMRNMIFYQALGQPSQPIAFPHWPLQLKVAQVEKQGD